MPTEPHPCQEIDTADPGLTALLARCHWNGGVCARFFGEELKFLPAERFLLSERFLQPMFTYWGLPNRQPVCRLVPSD